MKPVRDLFFAIALMLCCGSAHAGESEFLGPPVDRANVITYGQPDYYNAYAVDMPAVYYSANYVPTYVAPPAPPPTYINDTGSYCREYSQTVRIDGEIGESYGTACLQPDGSWRAVN